MKPEASQAEVHRIRVLPGTGVIIRTAGAAVWADGADLERIVRSARSVLDQSGGPEPSAAPGGALSAAVQGAGASGMAALVEVGGGWLASAFGSGKVIGGESEVVNEPSGRLVVGGRPFGAGSAEAVAEASPDAGPFDLAHGVVPGGGFVVAPASEPALQPAQPPAPAVPIAAAADSSPLAAALAMSMEISPVAVSTTGEVLAEAPEAPFAPPSAEPAAPSPGAPLSSRDPGATSPPPVAPPPLPGTAPDPSVPPPPGAAADASIPPPASASPASEPEVVALAPPPDRVIVSLRTPRVPPLPPRPPLPTTVREPEAHGVVVKGVRCGRDHFNNPMALYCRVCGLSMLQHTAAPFDGERPPLGVLVCDDGATYGLDRNVLVGSDPSVIDEVRTGRALGLSFAGDVRSLEPVHAAITLDGWDVVVSNRSQAGTTAVFLRGAASWHVPAPGAGVRLTPGAQVAVGERRVVFESNVRA